MVSPATRVLAIDTVDVPRGGRDGRRSIVRGVRTDRGDIECEIVIDAGGMYAAEIARLVGVRVPLVPLSHQYVVTDDVLGVDLAVALPRLPTLRDPDLLVYWRPEGTGLLMGGYERMPEASYAGPHVYDDIPADFNAKLLPPAGSASRRSRRTPQAASRDGRHRAQDRSSTARRRSLLTTSSASVRPSVAGFFVAAGFCAHGIAGAGGIGKVMAEWVLDGEPSLDLWHMDVSRFGPAYQSPSYTMLRTLETYRTYYDISYPEPGARVGSALAALTGLRVAPGAWRELRREGGLGAGELLRRPFRPRRRDGAADGDGPGATGRPPTGVEHQATRTCGGAVR